MASSLSVEIDSNHGLQILPEAIEEDEWLHRERYSWQGMDIIDLPDVLSQGEDEKVCGESQDIVWDLVDETEKACCDRHLSSATTGKPIFSNVFVLGSSNLGAYVSIPNSYNPHHESPSAPLKAQPTLLETAINATLRIRTTFQDKNGVECRSFGTGVLVSPKMLLTAKHCIDKENVLHIKVHGGLTVISQHFDGVGAVEATVVHLAARDFSMSKDSNGLFKHGADVGSLFTIAHFTSFLLPCSPTFLSNDLVAVISYPAVDKFLQYAEEALIKGSIDDSAIWEQYLPAIKSLYDSKIKEYAETTGIRMEKAKVTKSIVEVARKEVKQILYKELVNAFGSTHTGTMACSVGTLLHYNKVCLATSCSTLNGSSGAAICSISRPTDFIGIHRGGSKGFDVNCATSVDNPSVVKQYTSDVLPTLPHPQDKYWATRDTDGFVHYLGLHLSEIPSFSPWHGVAIKAKSRETASKKASKRKARHLEP